MVSSCRTADQQLCGSGCSFSCSCMTCVDGDSCNCSCTPLVALGIAIVALSALVAVLAVRCAMASGWPASGCGDTYMLHYSCAT